MKKEPNITFGNRICWNNSKTQLRINVLEGTTEVINASQRDKEMENMRQVKIEGYKNEKV